MLYGIAAVVVAALFGQFKIHKWHLSFAPALDRGAAYALLVIVAIGGGVFLFCLITAPARIHDEQTGKIEALTPKKAIGLSIVECGRSTLPHMHTVSYALKVQSLTPQKTLSNTRVRVLSIDPPTVAGELNRDVPFALGFFDKPIKQSAQADVQPGEGERVFLLQVGRINQFTGGNHVISFGANFKTSEGFGGFAPIGESTELRLLVEASADNVAATEATIVAKQEGSPENYNVFILYTNDNKAYS